MSAADKVKLNATTVRSDIVSSEYVAAAGLTNYLTLSSFSAHKKNGIGSFSMRFSAAIQLSENLEMSIGYFKSELIPTEEVSFPAFSGLNLCGKIKINTNGNLNVSITRRINPGGAISFGGTFLTISG